MTYYCVNKHAQINGDHEVHTYSCVYLPREENRLFLGDHATCATAVAQAKLTYSKSNGCAYCSRSCHTTEGRTNNP